MPLIPKLREGQSLRSGTLISFEFWFRSSCSVRVAATGNRRLRLWSRYWLVTIQIKQLIRHVHLQACRRGVMYDYRVSSSSLYEAGPAGFPSVFADIKKSSPEGSRPALAATAPSRVGPESNSGRFLLATRHSAARPPIFTSAPKRKKAGQQ